ncbi:type I restriction endonuclease [Desulfovibrio inopinatus]|uniref:type I restriction endonuclease n=1 Tax=Desulfovibrio inopinatus TaxID=102109 RepID=UPI00041D8BAF|nr:type I restriction endonuclease [Desulfovibrio inopinatus]
MDFAEQLYALSSKAQKQKDHLQTEEAAKNALVMPFINLLGYDVFNPLEVVPEFTADIGVKKGEKVDYAIMKDGSPIILIECKSCDSPLVQENSSQLYRYFSSVSEVRIAILTDGLRYLFFSDLENRNVLDPRPFMEFNLLAIDEALVPELKKLSKPRFDLESALFAASELKYTREIKKVLDAEIESPSDDFIRFFTSRVYTGRFTPAVREQFIDIVKRAVTHFINDKINARLKSAMSADPGTAIPSTPVEVTPSLQEDEGDHDDESAKSKIVTTPEETEGYLIVKSILRETCDVDRVAARDTQSYFGILLDDNNRKPICRLRFNTKQKYLGIITADKSEDKHPIDSLNDIYKHASALQEAVKMYDNENA